VGLLVVEVLDAVLDPAQEHIGAGQRVGGFLRHQAGACHPLQRIERGSGAQLRELAAAHHLQQLHGEFDLADAAARQLHVVGTLGPAGRTLAGLVADLLVQVAQRLEHVVIKIAAEHEGQHHGAQRGGAVAPGFGGCDHPALEPGKALPFAALDLEVFLQCVERHHRRAGVAVGPQRQIDPEHETMLGGVAHQRVDAAHGPGEVLVVADATPAVRQAGGFTVFVVDVDQVDVARHIELARAQLAHAHDPQRGGFAAGGGGRAVQGVELAPGLANGHMQHQLGQLGHAAGDFGQRCIRIAIEASQPLHHQLAQDAQRRARAFAPCAQLIEGRLHACPAWRARWQQVEQVGIAPAQPLHEAGVVRQGADGQRGGWRAALRCGRRRAR